MLRRILWAGPFLFVRVWAEVEGGDVVPQGEEEEEQGEGGFRGSALTEADVEVTAADVWGQSGDWWAVTTVGHSVDESGRIEQPAASVSAPPAGGESEKKKKS